MHYISTAIFTSKWAVANNNHTGNNKIFPAILKMIISTSFSLRTVACRDLPLLYNSFQSLMAH